MLLCPTHFHIWLLLIVYSVAVDAETVGSVDGLVILYYYFAKHTLNGQYPSFFTPVGVTAQTIVSDDMGSVYFCSGYSPNVARTRELMLPLTVQSALCLPPQHSSGGIVSDTPTAQSHRREPCFGCLPRPRWPR